MVKIMRYSILFILITNHFLFSQNSNFEIKGKVIDSETSEPLIGATIDVLESKEQTFTDIEGNFQLTITPDKNIIRVSFLSYKSFCTFLIDTLRNDLVIKLKPEPVWMGPPEILNYDVDSLLIKGKSDAEKDIQNSVYKLLQKYPITEVQDYYCKQYSFSFSVDTVNYREYKTAYNEIVLKNLSAKYGNKVLEILKSIDWVND